MTPAMLNWRKRKLSLAIWRNGAERIIHHSQYRVGPADDGNGLMVWETMPYGGRRVINPQRILRKVREA